jgi:hypothetical protein
MLGKYLVLLIIIGSHYLKNLKEWRILMKELLKNLAI